MMITDFNSPAQPENMVECLPWDTAQLGINTAKILPSALDEKKLGACLEYLRVKGMRLAYWCVPADNAEAIRAAQYFNAVLADHKLTYLIDLKNLKSTTMSDPDISIPVEIYAEKTPGEDLIQLAYQSGEYSRFRSDPHLTQNQFRAVYREWINNSANGNIADKIFIIRDHHDESRKILAMLTAGQKNQRGDIGLLAVHKTARGKHYGMALVQQAQQYFKAQHFVYGQVVTQKENLPACRLYEKCGYALEKTECFFHFWL